jgi:hypothetical protein
VALKYTIKDNYYQDALRLMRISKSFRDKEGVKKAVTVMATDKAKFALKDAGLITEEINQARGSDLVLAVEADSEEIACQVLKEMEQTVSAGESGGAGAGEDFLNQELRVINIGLDIFKDALLSQGVNVVQVDWEVPAKGDEKIISILKKMY